MTSQTKPAPRDKAVHLQLVKIFRAYYSAGTARYQYFEATGIRLPPQELPIELLNMTCGAKTKAGTGCMQKVVYSNGRCKLHGGLSTGAKTPEGKAKVALNGDKPKRKKQSP